MKYRKVQTATGDNERSTEGVHRQIVVCDQNAMASRLRESVERSHWEA